MKAIKNIIMFFFVMLFAVLSLIAYIFLFVGAFATRLPTDESWQISQNIFHFITNLIDD